MAAPEDRVRELQHFVAHDSIVNCLALGQRAGRLLVTGGNDKKVNLWVVGEHNFTQSLSGHSTPVVHVKFGHTEELVCSGSNCGLLNIWDIQAAEIVRTLHGHRAAIRCVDFDPNGTLLASGSFDTFIKVWHIQRKSLIFAFDGHRTAVDSVKFSPNGQLLASGGHDCLVKLWDLRARQLLKELRGHTEFITAIEFHPNGFLLATSSCNNIVIIWELTNFQRIATTDQGVGSIRCINSSQGGECLFAGSQNMLKVYGWNPARTYDTIPVNWGNIQDMATTQDELIGASLHLTSVALYAVDLNRVQQLNPELGADEEDESQLADTENTETYEEV